MKLFFVAGEKSGDLLGSQLLAALKKRASFTSFGIGGSLMQKEGLQCTTSLEELQVMGFSEVLLSLPRLLALLRKTCHSILKTQPEAVILIDYADFNLHLAKMLRKKGYRGKIVHYVAPTVWAWRKGRAKQMATTHDLLLSILPFEKPYFSLPCHYVGHPLVEASTRKQGTRDYLALFPGSRPHEIQHNLPLMLDALKPFSHKIALSCASPSLLPLIEKELKKRQLNYPIYPFEKREELMQNADLAIATSGTVTLELALHNVPTLVLYKLTTLNYLLGRYLFKINLPFYALPNIIAQEELCIEYYHRHIDASTLAQKLTKLDKEKEQRRERLSTLPTLLGPFKASEEAASHILKLVF